MRVLIAQRRIEVGQRLVEQEHRRLAHDGAADGDALALAAGEVARPAVEQGVELQHLAPPRARAGRPRPSSALVNLQAEGHVLADVHVRIERVGLEHHGDLALGRRQRR